ncbi:MAG TPA: S8 family serine peptidase [Planctomycetota bacterium]
MISIQGSAAVLLFLGSPSLAQDVGPRPLASDQTIRVFVELEAPPTSVTQHAAVGLEHAFDARVHEQRLRAEQDSFLASLAAEGVHFRVTTTPLRLATGVWHKENRFTFLINGVELAVRAGQVQRLRERAGVKRITPEEELRLDLDNSVRYVRASDGPGNKTIFARNGGPLTRYDGAGQVIAIIDTGIDHTHPAFDTRFSDAAFASRTGDLRPMRLAGQAYLEGTHHPKVVYYLALTASSSEDDVGHGTHCATDAAGLKVQGPGLDRIPGNADDRIIEGVAPGALLMGYKLCETTFTCVGTGAALVTALEDALSPTDVAGNPKPMATVVNMSFGGSGDADSPSAVAADNAVLLGAVMVASAGNAGPEERTLGAPAAGRRVIAVGACRDPGAINNEVDVMPANALRYGPVGASTGAQDDTGLAKAPQDIVINALIMAGSPDVTFGLGQHYVYCGLADSPDQVPAQVAGRVALIERGSQVDVGVTGSGAFANKVAQVTAQGAIAALIFNNVPGELEAATAAASTIPVYGLSKASGEYLRDTLGFQSPLFDPESSLTWGTLSSFPVRLNLPDASTFAPSTTGFSSRGPIANSRYVKPDVTAPGENIYGGTIAAGGVSTGGGTMSDPSRFISVSGTSFSGPTTAGAVALLRQAMLEAGGDTPLGGPGLRSGASALDQLVQSEAVPASKVRAALQNTCTNLRAADGETPLADGDDRSFIHALGSGLIHVVQAVDARAYLGTNELLGPSADDAGDPDFLPSHSFGENEVIATGVADQLESITVTLESAGPGGAGTYALSLVDGGGLRGDVTRPISGTTGFDVSLSAPSVSIADSPGSRASFEVRVSVDGRPAPAGLAAAGTDVQGLPATEFLWWVVASGSNGEVLRMPFSYRAVVQLPDPERKPPFLAAIEDDAVPDQTTSGEDRDGQFHLSWTYPAEPAEQPCGFVIQRARRLAGIHADAAEELLVQGDNSLWTGDDTWTTAVHPDTLTNGYSPVYADEQDVRLTSAAPISIPEGGAMLRFRSYEDIEEGFDHGYVEVSGDGGPFLPMAVYTGAFSGERTIDLSPFGGQDVLVRFHFVTDQLISAPAYLGWFLDDIVLESGDFHAIATVDGSTLSFDVRPHKLRSIETLTEHYRVAARFGGGCAEVGPFSNVRSITVRGEE